MKKLLTILTISIFALSGCSPQLAESETTTGQQTDAPQTSAAPGTVNCEYVADARPAAKAVNPPASVNVRAVGTSSVTMMLNGKPVEITLDLEQAPCTANSFESLASQGYFDNTQCHRLVDGNGLYILQCGDPTATGTGGPGYVFADELAGITGYPAGTVAMANAGPNTNGSQFFLVYEESMLPPNYTVFGTVDVVGLEEIRAIAMGGQDGSSGASGGGKPELPAEISQMSVG
ncbi:MAG: peptidylprolyl isomerase [Propionibacteriaceae bacterium]|nr:peptidylprolyl isomerase [Propionibacteriaceae bacterium]